MIKCPNCGWVGEFKDLYPLDPWGASHCCPDCSTGYVAKWWNENS